MENVDFHPRGHFFLEISKEKARVACRVACVLHACCMCVACVLHVRCMSRATQITSLNCGSGMAGTRILGGRREILEAENLGSAITSESILCVQYFSCTWRCRMSVHVRAGKKDRKLRSKHRGECCSVFF